MAEEPPFQWRTFLPLFGIGSALTALYRHRRDVDPQSALPESLYVGLLWLGLSLIVIAFLVSVTSIASHGVLLVWRKAILRFFEPPRYKCRVVRYNELEELQSYWERFFTSDMSDLAQAQGWHRKNGKLCWFLFEVAGRHGRKHHKPRLVGSYSILPLTKKAAEQVARDELSGAKLLAEHITKPSATPTAVYLGGLVADGVFAKAELLARVAERLEQYQAKGITVYTRPVTKDGLRLVEKYDFVPVVQGHTGLKHVYVKDDTPDETA